MCHISDQCFEMSFSILTMSCLPSGVLLLLIRGVGALPWLSVLFFPSFALGIKYSYGQQSFFACIYSFFPLICCNHRSIPPLWSFGTSWMHCPPADLVLCLQVFLSLEFSHFFCVLPPLLCQFSTYPVNFLKSPLIFQHFSSALSWSINAFPCSVNFH